MQSKGLTKRNTSMLLGIGFALTAFTACGYTFEDDYVAYPCLTPTYSDYHSPLCRDWRCKSDNALPEDKCPEADAGTSSSSSSGSGVWCSGTCVRNGPIGFDPPRPVYIGPPVEKYLYGCPSNIGATASRTYADLNVPEQGCFACACGSPDGSCSTKPNALFAHASSCDAPEIETLDFNGPMDWDGTCTNVNAVAQGAECPAGSGNFCARSITSTYLLEPIEKCEPIVVPVPGLTGDTISWDKMVLACNSNVLPEPCVDIASDTCLPSVPYDEPEWHYCVRKEGITDCPTIFDSSYTKQYIAYPSNGFTDTTACTACECFPSGGACFGTLRVYSDDSCSTNEILAHGVGSGMRDCWDLLPFGDALGSKQITDLAYVPGRCEPSGGEPIGSVELHDDDAVTWCCIP